MLGKLALVVISSQNRADSVVIRKGMLGDCDKETTFGILDYFYEQGGNFIDTYEYVLYPKTESS
jgi:aryl-alcohol dehydrogenase-like predicted oxidoreductase